MTIHLFLFDIVDRVFPSGRRFGVFCFLIFPSLIAFLFSGVIN